MATCDMGFEHEEVIAAEPEPVIMEADPGPNEHDVEIAAIEAEASIEREKIWTEQAGLELQGEVAQLRGELAGMREVLDRLSPPEPEPEPVVIPIPDPGPVEEPEAVPGPPEVPEIKDSGGNKAGMWAGYR